MNSGELEVMKNRENLSQILQKMFQSKGFEIASVLSKGINLFSILSQ